MMYSEETGETEKVVETGETQKVVKLEENSKVRNVVKNVSNELSCHQYFWAMYAKWVDKK